MKQFDVTGMSCAACSAKVEKAVNALEGVSSCAVSLLTNSMSVEGNVSDRQIIEAVREAGYDANVKGEKKTAESEDKETETIKTRLIVSIAVLLVLMYFSMGVSMAGFPVPSFLKDNYLGLGLIQMILASTVMVLNNRFFVSGFKAVLHGAANMDTLVALGSMSAFCYSVFGLFAMTVGYTTGNMELVHKYHHEFYFESAAMILAFITVGKMLEASSKGKTTSALKGLMKLAPKKATVIRDGQEQIVDIELVQIQDVFVVKPGESIPVDGVVLEGESAVNESAMTGESIPVDKTVHSQVSAGTVNLNGYLKCRATAVGKDTTLSQIIQMVSDASATKAPIAKIADQVAGVFVPAVCGIALFTLIVWLLVGKPFGFAIGRAISVLVISCPCSLGLATPVAIMVGNGVGAKNGILFKTASSLEQAGKAQIVVLDKTGTITQGKPEVTDIVSEDEKLLIDYAVALEKKSEHPLAKAITTLDVQQSFNTESFTALPGNGLKAVINGCEIYGGSYQFISRKASVSDEMKQIVEKLAGEGKTPLLFSKDGKLLGIIAVADVVKPESREAIAQLKNMGIYTVMLTGDNKLTATAIGRQVEVDQVVSDVLPQSKASVVKQLQQYGKVIMVGDGINDAPALTLADTGIAIGAGTDVAIDAADIVLMKSRLTDVPAAIRLSRKTLTNIHQNLGWAFGYNIIGIPLAAGLFISLLGWQMSPMFGAACMSCSSFLVVSNALRLNFVNIFDGHKDQKRERIEVEEIIQEEETMTKTMHIEGMMCHHCEAAVKKALEKLDGVVSAEVSHETGTAIVTLSQDVDNAVLTEAVVAKDYEVTSID